MFPFWSLTCFIKKADLELALTLILAFQEELKSDAVEIDEHEQFYYFGKTHSHVILCW